MPSSNYGRGSLRRTPKKNNKNVWQYRFYYTDAFNQPVQKSIVIHATTERDAWKIARVEQLQFEAKLKTKGVIKKERRLNDLFIQYIEHIESRVEPTTIKGYQVAWNHALKKLHKVPVSQLSAQMIKDALKLYAETPVPAQQYKGNRFPAPRSNERVYTTLGTFIKWLIYEDYLDINPMLKVRKPRIKESDRKLPATFSENEYNKYLNACSDYDKKNNTHYAVITYVSRMTGMRLGEVLALTFREIDFDNKILFVKQALNEFRELKIPKAHSQRRIMLSDSFIEVIREHLGKIAIQAGNAKEYWQDNDLLFPDQFGRYVKKGTLASRLGRIRKTINLRPELKHKNLRHTFATDLINSGFDIKTVQEMLGHKHSTTTEKHYQGLSQRSQVEITEHLERRVITPAKAKALQDILED